LSIVAPLSSERVNLYVVLDLKKKWIRFLRAF
jgi:hypothetical protein